MAKVILSLICISQFLLLQIIFFSSVNAGSEFDLPTAKIYKVDENDRILSIWDKIENSQAVIEDVDSLRLECTASHPVQWIYSGNGIPVSSSKITLSRSRVSKELETLYKATVFINPLKEHHTGRYQCSSTELIDSETYLYIYVPGQSIFTSLNGKDIHLEKNETTVLIPCTVSNPKAIVTLEKQVGPTLQQIQVKSQDAIQYNPREGFTVKLDELVAEPEGTFVCTAKLDHLVRGVEYTLSFKDNFNNRFRPENTRVDGCTNHTCGDNAICHLISDKPTCQCEERFIGDAETRCSLTCESHDDCPDNKSCFVDRECRSPCLHSVVGCGIQSLCKVENHRPVCYCGPDFVGDPKRQCFNTLQGSPGDVPSTPTKPTQKPSTNDPFLPTKCRKNEDCPSDKQCRRLGSSLECTDGCQFTLCGQNSKCSMINHNPQCFCQAGFSGDPFGECEPIRLVQADQPQSQEVEQLTSAETCKSPEACGPYSKCKINRRGRDRCLCKEGYTGQPPNCKPNNCGANSDCPVNQVCSNSTTVLGTDTPICIDVCGSRICGEGAECQRGICRCRLGFTGNPFQKCKDDSQLNQDCTIDNDCGPSLRCKTEATQRKCADPCKELLRCNAGTVCQVEKHIANCKCPSGYTGNEVIGCTRDFTIENLSVGSGRSSRASAECQTISCGQNSECRIQDGKPACFCQSGFVGIPPRCRAECLSNEDCSEKHACIQKRCRSACFKKCGKNTNCSVGVGPVTTERVVICSCTDGYSGNPEVGCEPGNS